MRSCKSCKRYVRESKCVFCGAEDLAALPAHVSGNGLSRAAMVLGAAATAAALSAASCSSSTPAYGAPLDDSSTDDTSAVALYGAVPADASVDGASDSSANDSSPVALYGAVPTDGGGNMPAYGDPPK